MRIVLYYESSILGGVEVLFANIVNSLKNSNSKLSAVIYSSQEDSIYKTLVEPVDILASSKDISESDVIITPLSSVYDAVWCFAAVENVKVLTWSLQPTNALVLTPVISKLLPLGMKITKWVHKTLFYYNYYLNKKLIHTLIQNKSLVCMDGDNINGVEYFYSLSISNKSFLPIPITDGDLGNEVCCTKEKVKIIWLGRFDNFKLIPLCNLFSKTHNTAITISFIGGEDLGELGGILRNKGIDHNVLQVMPREGLASFLAFEKFDLAIAMGTSALELGVRAIPTLVINPSYKKGEKARLNWLFNAKEYSLGAFNLSGKEEVEEVTFDNALTQVRSFNKKVELSKKTFDYVMSNHTINSTISLLESLTTQAQCDLKSISPFLYKNHLLKIKTLIRLRRL